MAQIPAGALNINTLSPDQLAQLTAAPAPDRATPADEPTDDTLPGQQAVPEGAIPIRQLSPKALAALTKPEPMGGTEAAGRLFYKHLTFGTSPGASREKEEQAAREHPYLNIATAIPAFAAQTAALGPLATAGKAVEGAGMLARAARGAGAAADFALLPNMEARTALQSARTGAKLGGIYSAGEAAGSDLTNPDKTWGQTVRDVAVSGGLGTAGGAVLGAGAHGLSRVAGAVANRTMPDLTEALTAARAPEGQGLRDIVRAAGYDDADLDRLAANLDRAQTDPVLAARYKGLNLLEALKAGELKPTSTGELKPDVVTTRNLDDLAKHWANTEGRGQNIAAEAFASRKNEMSSDMQGDIDQFFGSGNRDQDATAIAARREAIGKRYDKLRDSGGLVKVDELGTMQQVSPVFDRALRYAAQNDAIENPGSQWPSLWSGGKLGDTVATLSPANMLDIHHFLVMNARPKVGGDPAEAVMAGKLKNWFTGWADRNFPKHPALRKDYAQLRRVMDATEKGADLPPVSGGTDHPSLVFFRQQARELRQAEDLLTKRQAAMALAARDNASQASMNSYLGRVTQAQKQADNARAVIDEFRKARGEGLKQFLAERGDNGPSQLVRQLTTQEGKRRIVELLGRDQGKAYIESLYNKALQQRLGNTLYGGSDTAFKLQKRESIDALSNAVAGILHMRPKAVWDATRELASSAYRQQRADRGNEIMAQQGIENVRNILGSLRAQQQLRQTGHPFVRNPLLKYANPASAGALGNMTPFAGGEQQRHR